MTSPGVMFNANVLSLYLFLWRQWELISDILFNKFLSGSSYISSCNISWKSSYQTKDSKVIYMKLWVFETWLYFYHYSIKSLYCTWYIYIYNFYLYMYIYIYKILNVKILKYIKWFKWFLRSIQTRYLE